MATTTNTFQEWTDDIERARSQLGIQGLSVAVIHQGQVIYAQGFGKRNDADPFTPEASERRLMTSRWKYVLIMLTIINTQGPLHSPLAWLLDTLAHRLPDKGIHGRCGW